MKIEHNNYCGYALNDLEEYTRRLDAHNMTISANINRVLAKLIKRAQKFVLPPDGIVTLNFHETFSEADAEIVRLPYPVIAIEYAMKPRNHSEDFTSIVVSSSKRIALAFYKSALGDDLQYLEHMPGTLEYNEGIIVWPISWLDKEKMWSPCWAGVIVPMPIQFTELDPHTVRIMDQTNVKHSNKALVVSKYLHGEYAMMTADAHIESGNDPVQMLSYDTEGELQSVISMCCALNCQNVELQNAQIAKRKATEKKSPKMYFEYKSLVLKPFEPKSVSESKGGTHAKPREHLRRGHFRRLRNGERMWFNDKTINLGVGKVEKDYYIKGDDDARD